MYTHTHTPLRSRAISIYLSIYLSISIYIYIFESFSEVGPKYVTFNLKNKVHTGKLKSGYLINMTVLLLNLENPSMEMLLFSYQGGVKVRHHPTSSS